MVSWSRWESDAGSGYCSQEVKSTFSEVVLSHLTFCEYFHFVKPYTFYISEEVLSFLLYDINLTAVVTLKTNIVPCRI